MFCAQSSLLRKLNVRDALLLMDYMWRYATELDLAFNAILIPICVTLRRLTPGSVTYKCVRWMLVGCVGAMNLFAYIHLTVTGRYAHYCAIVQTANNGIIVDTNASDRAKYAKLRAVVDAVVVILCLTAF